MAFICTVNTDGSLTIQKDGVPVSEDPNDQNYLDFLHWASTQDTRSEGYPFSGVGYFFTEIRPLVEHLKKFGAHLYVSRDGETRFVQCGSERPFSTLRHRFFNLPKGKAWPEDSEHEVSGFGGREKHGLKSVDSSTWLTQELVDLINREIQDDTSEIRKVSTWAVERSFVYIDVADFSKMPPGQQVLVINSIVKMVDDKDLWAAGAPSDARANVLAMMCIGDGYIFVFKDANEAAFFAAYLAHLVEVLLAGGKLPVEFHYRMGAHVGKVFSFYDPGRKDWNYIGDGINGGQRVLGAIKEADDLLFISSQLRKAITPTSGNPGLSEIITNSINRGRRPDKHGKMWRVYEINHTNVMSTFNNQIISKNW
jgi:class 3 adenylate cyclase